MALELNAKVKFGPDTRRWDFVFGASAARAIWNSHVGLKKNESVPLHGDLGQGQQKKIKETISRINTCLKSILFE